MISIQLIKRLNIKTIYGEKITIDNKEFSKGQIYGGLIFGFGVVAITLLSAIAGTWVYGKFSNKLPH